MKNPVVHLMATLGFLQSIIRRTSGSNYGNELSNFQAILDTILAMLLNQLIANNR